MFLRNLLQHAQKSLTRRPAPTELETRLGHVFKDRSLLEMALTLPSYRMETQGAAPDNQRLEFLGDAVLGFITAQLCYEAYPDIDEGLLTSLRTQMASGRRLADVARSLNLGPCLRMSRGEERQFGRNRDGALSDALEALFGALWLDGGLPVARDAVLRLIGIPEPTASADEEDNPKGRLQIFIQQNRLPLPEYSVVEKNGPTHEPNFRIRVTCNDISAEAEGRSKRIAERLAAEQLLGLLQAQGEQGRLNREDSTGKCVEEEKQGRLNREDSTGKENLEIENEK